MNSSIVESEAAIETVASIFRHSDERDVARTLWGASILVTASARAFGFNMVLIMHRRDQGVPPLSNVRVGILIYSFMLFAILSPWIKDSQAEAFWASKSAVHKLVSYIVAATSLYTYLAQTRSYRCLFLGAIAIGALQWALLTTTATAEFAALKGDYTLTDTLASSLFAMSWSGFSSYIPWKVRVQVGYLKILVVLGASEAVLIAVAAALLARQVDLSGSPRFCT